MRVAFLTHEPFYPPSGGGSAEAVYLVQELIQRGHEVHLFCPAFPDSDKTQKGIQCHLFTTWEMGRYTALRNFKYLAYLIFLRRMVERAARHVRFDLVLGQHAIAAVVAGLLRHKLRVPVVMNFLDYLTGFMETWPPYIAPRPLIRALERFELSMPNRYQADGLMTVSDTLADFFANAGYPRERIRPIYYGYDAKLFRPLETAGGESAKTPVIAMHGSFDHHHLGRIALGKPAYVVSIDPDQNRVVLGSDEDLQRQTRQLQEEAAERARGVGTDASPGDSVDPARPGGPILAGAVVVTGQSRRWPGLTQNRATQSRRTISSNP